MKITLKKLVTTASPTNEPTNDPTNTPTNEITDAPTKEPSTGPTREPTYADRRADYIVVGAGPGGSFAASELAKSDTGSVLLLEWGVDDSEVIEW